MNVLIAAPDRDFLSCYQKIFEADGHEATVSFDGFQFMACLREKKYDLVLLDRNLPRVEHDKLMKLVNDLKIPAIVLQGKRMNARLLLKEALADSYLIYPFEPLEVSEHIGEILQKRQSREIRMVGDARIDLGSFLLDDKVRITNEEINILLHLQRFGETGKESTGPDPRVLPLKHGLYYVNALNQKLESLHKAVRIQYTMNEGYGLVSV